MSKTIYQDTAGQAPAKELSNIKIALVLGGGGSKGIAHIGAIEALVENNIPIDLIVGTSAGSAMGAFYADGQSIEEIKQKLMPASKWDVLDPSFSQAMQMFSNPTGILRGRAMKKFIEQNIKAKNLEDLKIPLVVVSADIDTGELYLIRTGLVSAAVNASSAIPGIFAPVKIYNKTLVDGGIIEPVPVRVAKIYQPKMIIAIDITSPAPPTKIYNAFELVYKANWIAYYQLARMQSKLADIDIHPELAGHGIFEDNKKQELFDAGKKAALQQIPSILKKMKELGITIKR
jgi:NTE family protein